MSEDDKNIAIHAAYDDLLPYDESHPEKGLLCAVLLTAISDLQKPGDPQEQATQFFLNEDEEYLFSFRSICDYLSVDPKRILKVTGLKPDDEG